MADPASRFQAAVAARAQEGARRFGLMAVSGAFFAIAAAFLTVAAWIVISDAQSAQLAALVIGVFYLITGVVFRVMARSPKPVQPVRPATAATDTPPKGRGAAYPPLAEAFVFGLDTALRLRRSRRDR